MPKRTDINSILLIGSGAIIIGQACEFDSARCVAGGRLSRLVALERRVRMVNGDAQRLPFRRHAFSAVVSQEGLLHVPDKAAVLAECARVLRPGGRIAFSDWVATGRLADGERRRLGEWMAAVTLSSIDGYREMLGRAGFAGIDAEDVSAQWTAILRERRRVYRGARDEAVARFGHARYDEYDQLHAYFAGLVESGKLGGARFSGRAGPGTS